MHPAVVALLAISVVGAILLRGAFVRGEVLSSSATFVKNGPYDATTRAATPEGVRVISDPAVMFTPWLNFAADEFAAEGHLPLWKNTSFCGAPFIGNGQSAAFFPPILAAIALGAPAAALAWIALLKIVVAGLGMYFLARRLGTTPAGALIAGFVFALGGFSMTFLLYPPTNVSCLLPWLLVACDMGAMRPTATRLGFIALVAGLQHLGGHPETAFHVQAFAAVLVVLRVLSSRDGAGFGTVARRIALVAVAFVLGALLGGVQIVPLLEYIRESSAFELRSRTDIGLPFAAAPLASILFALGAAATWGSARLAMRATRPWIPGLALLASVVVMTAAAKLAGMRGDPVLLLAADWFGDPNAYRGNGNYLEVNGAFSGSALVLAVAGAVLRRREGLCRLATGVAILSILVGYGAPFITPLIESIPGFEVAINSRMQLFTLLAIAFLAAAGFDALASTSVDPIARRRFAWVGGAMFGAWIVAHAISISSARGYGIPLWKPIAKAAPLEAGFVELAANSSSGDFGAWVAAPVKMTEAVLLFGRTGAAAASILALPPALAAHRDSLANAKFPLFIRIRDPSDRAALASAPVRVLTYDEAGNTYLSPALFAKRSWPTWLFSESLPGGRSAMQLSLLGLGALLVFGLVRARGGLLVAGRFALGLIVVSSMIEFASGLLPTIPAGSFYPPSKSIDALRAFGPAARVASPYPTAIAPEIGTFYGLREVTGYDALAPRHIARILRLITATAETRGTSAVARDLQMRLFGLLAVKGVFENPGLETWNDPTRDREFRIGENPFYLPRARLVTGVVIEPDDSLALARLTDPTFDAASNLILASGSERPSRGEGGRATIETDRTDLVRIGIAPNGDGFLVLADTFFPGWRAFVDGKETEIVRANTALRAVPVTKDDRIVEFRYEPASFRIGRALSIFAAIATLALFAWGALGGSWRWGRPGLG